MLLQIQQQQTLTDAMISGISKPHKSAAKVTKDANDIVAASGGQVSWQEAWDMALKLS